MFLVSPSSATEARRSNGASWCTKRNAKNPSSLYGTVSEKLKNNLQKLSCFDQNRYLLILWVTILCKELRFFVLRSVYQDPSFELSKQLFGNFPIVHPKGGPLWFRTSHKLIAPLKITESWKQNYFCEQNCKWIKNSDGTACLKGGIKMSFKKESH